MNNPISVPEAEGMRFFMRMAEATHTIPKTMQAGAYIPKCFKARSPPDTPSLSRKRKTPESLSLSCSKKRRREKYARSRKMSGKSKLAKTPDSKSVPTVQPWLSFVSIRHFPIVCKPSMIAPMFLLSAVMRNACSLRLPNPTRSCGRSLMGRYRFLPSSGNEKFLSLSSWTMPFTDGNAFQPILSDAVPNASLAWMLARG